MAFLPAISTRVRTALGWVLVVTAVQAALTIAHFLRGADIYEDPSRDHVVVPALVALGLAAALAALFAWRPSVLSLGALVLVDAIPFVGMFGLYHGGFGHAFKLLLFAWGTSPARLQAIFDSPDFAVPDDIVFEISGVATFAVGLLLAWLLARLVRVAKLAHEEANASDAPGPSAGRA